MFLVTISTVKTLAGVVTPMPAAIRTIMPRVRFVFSIVIAYTVLFCIALLVYGLIEAQFSIGFPVRTADIIVPFCFLGFLILLFMLYQIFSQTPGSRASSLLRAGALISLLFFLPQSYLIARGLSWFMHSGLFGFVMCNVVEAAFGRFLLMLIHGQPMYPSDRKRLEYHPQLKRNQGAKNRNDAKRSTVKPVTAVKR